MTESAHGPRLGLAGPPAATGASRAPPVAGAVFQPFGGIGRGLYLLGEGGLYIPRFTVAGFDIPPDRFIPGLYYVIAAAFLGSTLILWRISPSPFGAALRAIRDNDTRALFIGLSVRTYRWTAFVLSGLFTGLAGALYGELTRQITEQLHWLLSAQLVFMTVLGGSRHFLGPVAGAFAFLVLEDFSLRLTGQVPVPLGRRKHESTGGAIGSRSVLKGFLGQSQDDSRRSGRSEGSPRRRAPFSLPTQILFANGSAHSPSLSDTKVTGRFWHFTDREVVALGP